MGKRASRSKTGRGNKYGAKPKTVDGVRFASTSEASRYEFLKERERFGELSRLALQPRFPLIVNGKLATTYVADFAYQVGEKWYYEDVKGVSTRLFKLKRKLVAILYGIKIIEIPARAVRRVPPGDRPGQ